MGLASMIIYSKIGDQWLVSMSEEVQRVHHLLKKKVICDYVENMCLNDLKDIAQSFQMVFIFINPGFNLVHNLHELASEFTDFKLGFFPKVYCDFCHPANICTRFCDVGNI